MVMNKFELEYFTNIINSYSDLEYLFSTILYSAGPTLMKEKASTLLNFSDGNHHLRSSWDRYKGEVLNRFKVEFIELKKDAHSTWVLFYDRETLEDVIRGERNIEFLARFGYRNEMNIEECLLKLSRRFEYCCPHEIGIFLGYPLDDVVFFINGSKGKCKMTGYWKVYDNIEEAKNTFDKYDRIRADFINLMISGVRPTDVYIN